MAACVRPTSIHGIVTLFRADYTVLMCYVKPGLRCAPYVTRQARKAQHAVLDAYAAMQDDRDNPQLVEIFEKRLSEREHWHEEYKYTTAGIEELKTKVASMDSGERKDQHQAELETNLRIRKERIEAAKSVPVQHSEVESLAVSKLDYPDSFDTTTQSRIGWTNEEHDRRPIQGVEELSDAWMSQLNEEEIAALHWYTSDSTAYSKSVDTNDPKTAQARNNLHSAVDKGHRLERPVVVFSGVSDGKLPSIRELVRTGTMTTNRITSATFNPAVVNSFAENYSDRDEGTYVLEILTDRVCPTASVITGQGGSEEETLIPAHTTLELVNVLNDVEYLWGEDEQGKSFGRTHRNVLQVRVKD